MCIRDSIQPGDLLRYVAEEYAPGRMVAVAAGGYNREEMLACIHSTLGGLKPGAPRPTADAPAFTPGVVLRKKKFEQVSLELAVPGLTLDVYKRQLFDSLVNTFGTAGTGGFAIKNASIGFYNSAYVDGVITVFMLLFGINFNLYFLLLMRDFKQVLKSEELRVYLGVALTAICLLYTSVRYRRRPAVLAVKRIPAQSRGCWFYC